MPKDKNSSHFSVEKILLEADEHHYRNTQLATTQSKTDFGVSNSNVLNLQHNPYI